MNIKSMINKIKQEENESINTLHMTANENRLSKTAEYFLGSPLSYRYLLGDHIVRKDEEVVNTGSFMFKGMPAVTELEIAANDAMKSMFDAAHVDFRPTSGMSASLSTAMILSNPGDNIYSLKYTFGGHFATKHFYERMGRNQYDIAIDYKNLDLDYLTFEEQVREIPADLIILEPGTPLYSLDISRIRKIVGPDTIIIYDGAHTLGLIAGGKFQRPFVEGADIIQGNTHKTFPGPQKGVIMTKTKEMGKIIRDGISRGTISSTHVHHSIALFVTVLEMYKYAEDYANQIIKNSTRLAKSLAARGFEILQRDGVYTESEQLLILDDNNYENCRRLHEAAISTNARQGFDREVIRVGVQEITRRGMKESDMNTIADFYEQIIHKKANTEKIHSDIHEFNSEFKHIYYSFDEKDTDILYSDSANEFVEISEVLSLQ